MLSCKVSQQSTSSTVSVSNYVAHWSAVNEVNVLNYEVQSTTDTSAAGVTTLTTIPADSTGNYGYTLPLVTAFYRIKANRKKSKPYYTKYIFMAADSLVVITNMKVKTSWLNDVLQWNTLNESQVKYYLIEKSEGGRFEIESKTAPKGDSKYSQNVYRGNKNYTYRNTPFYKDGTIGKTLNFK